MDPLFPMGTPVRVRVMWIEYPGKLKMVRYWDFGGGCGVIRASAPLQTPVLNIPDATPTECSVSCSVEEIPGANACETGQAPDFALFILSPNLHKIFMSTIFGFRVVN